VKAVNSLTPPDLHLASAAVGWLELGNSAEALAELSQMSAVSRLNPGVLEIEYAIHAHVQDWPAALESARRLLAAAPERAIGWLHQAYALRRAPGGGLSAAWDALLPAAEKFPGEAAIHFNLACYACQAGKLADAREWLQRASAVGDKKAMRSMALADPDLQPLWPELAGR